MSVNETDKCPICNEFKNSMLQLECYHDPCLACAAIAHSQQKQARSTMASSAGKENYVCTVCGEKTALERETLRELEDIARRQEHLLDKPPTLSARRRSPVKTSTLPRGYIEEESQEESITRSKSGRKIAPPNQN